MATFIVTEVVEYRVQADNAEDAVEVIIQAEDRDKFFEAVTDRYAIPVEAADDRAVTTSVWHPPRVGRLPIRCPFCSGSDVQMIIEWEAQSTQDATNVATLHEWQCAACDGCSFWV